MTGGVDLFLIEKQAGKWRLAGKPEQVAPSGSLRDVSRTTPLNEITNPDDIVPGPRGYTQDQLRRKSELERLRATS